MDMRETTPSAKDSRTLAVGGWEVEPLSNCIRRGDEVVRLEPKVMQVLVYLAAHPGEVVTRQALEDSVWAGMVVGYDALTNAIIKLRKALGDDSRKPHVIETISKTGYRLVASVNDSPTTEASVTRKLAAILYADVAGYSRLTGEDEDGTHRILRTYLSVITTSIGTHKGRVVHYAGDAVLADFATVSDALSCAVDIQRDLKDCNQALPDDRKVQFRIGVNLGEVIVDQDEIYGDGVNVAARLETLVDPGGICIAESVHTSIGKKLPLSYAFMGEQSVKNIEKPVRTYRVLLEEEAVPKAAPSGTRSKRPLVMASAAAVVLVVVVVGMLTWLKPWAPGIEPASEERMALPLPDKPSLAVLPFTNMSDDPKQEYFVDGMTDDLITDLSKLSGLFVIARNSVFTYKGKPVKVRQVAEELGVRYVLEGSVRRAGERVRINVQLIDAATGGHLWAERYDGSLTDVFALQDRVTRKIVVALALGLTPEEENNRNQIETDDPRAYDAFLQGWEHYRRGSPEELSKAVSFLEQAIKWDPNYTRAHTALAAVYWRSYSNWWWESLGLSYSFLAREKTNQYLEEAMKAPSALAYQVAAEIAANLGRTPDKALAEAERAIALDPNDPASHLAMATALLKVGKPAEAEQRVRQAMRLDPLYPTSYLVLLARAEFAMARYRDAAATLERAANRNPTNDRLFVYLTATYGHLGRQADAKAALDNANQLRAKAGWGALTVLSVDPFSLLWVGDSKPLKEGLRKAGVNSGADWLRRIKTVSPGLEIEGATTINADEAKALHEQNIRFIDVSYLWHQERIPDAHFLYASKERGDTEFNEVRLAKIVDRTQRLVVYSSRENKSAAIACAKALIWGFQHVYYFENGLQKWKAAGYPVEGS